MWGYSGQKGGPEMSHKIKMELQEVLQLFTWTENWKLKKLKNSKFEDPDKLRKISAPNHRQLTWPFEISPESLEYAYLHLTRNCIIYVKRSHVFFPCLDRGSCFKILHGNTVNNLTKWHNAWKLHIHGVGQINTNSKLAERIWAH